MGNKKTIYYLKEDIMGKQDFLGFNAEEVNKYEKEYYDFQQSKPGFDLTFYGNWQRDFGKLIIELADLKSDPGKEWVSVLDVGCGTALNLRAIDELGIFSHLIGVDRSEYIINKIIPTLHDWGSYFEFYATPSHDLSMIGDNDIDLLVCTQTLEHIVSEEKLHETLDEFDRILHKDGKIIIIIPVKKEKGNDDDHNNLHKLMHTGTWWSKIFSKYFKSESFKARQIFKESELKPDRSGEKTFYEEYETWAIFRLIKK